MRRFVLLCLALLASGSAAAQSVRLTLLDHVVGTEIVNNAPLPVGTAVWVVSKNDPRSVRLRSGYGEVTAGLASARRDRIVSDGQTDGRYQPTARSRRSYFVVARLPDGRLFQSYVKTADAGWQPGFDAVSGGRVSMGVATGAAAQTLRAALPSPAAAPAATAPPAAATTPAPDPDRPTAIASPPGAPDTLARPDTTALDSLGGLPASAFDTLVTERTGDDGLDEATLVAESDVDRPVWPWALGGLLAGAALTAAVLLPLHRRRLDRQRDHLLRLLPDTDTRAAVDAERDASLDAQRAADTARFDRTMQQIDTLRAMLRDRDDEIRRLRGDPAMPGTAPQGPGDPPAVG